MLLSKGRKNRFASISNVVSRFPNLRVPLLEDNPLHVLVSSGPLCLFLWELGLRKVAQENADAPATDIAVNNKVICL